MAKYTLDVGQRGRQLTIEGLHVGDNGFRIFDFSFSERGKPFPLPEGCIATIYATLPGGVVIYETCTIEDDSALYELRGGTDEPSITAKAGKVDCEIRITDSEGNVITSPKFAFIIDKVLQDDDAIEATESFSALTKTLSEVQEIKAGYEGAIEDVAAAVESANRATENAEAALSAAEGSLSKADEALDNANEAIEKANDALENAETGLMSKLDKVEGEVGNAAVIGEGGNLIDAGYKPSKEYLIKYYDSATITDAQKAELREIITAIIGDSSNFGIVMNAGGNLLPASLVREGRYNRIVATQHGVNSYIYTISLSSAGAVTTASEWLYLSTYTESFGSSVKAPTANVVAQFVADYVSEHGGNVSDADIAAAIEAYFEENPMVTEETDPTVPAWAKAATKPSYTAAEVGALPSTYTPPDQTAEQVGADPKGTAAGVVSAHNTSDDAHNDIRLLIKALTDRLNGFLDIDDTTADQLSEVLGLISDNADLIEGITTSKVNVSDIINNLTTNVANKPLSAAQGVALKKLIDAITVPTKLSDLSGDTTHRTVTDAEKTAWNAKSNFSGNYNDLTGKPTIPTVPTKVSEFTNDAGYIKSAELESAVDDALTEAKESGEFDGADGERGTGLLYITTAPSSYTTATGGFTPVYRIALSTVKTQSKATKVLVGDTLSYSFYHYPVGYVDSSYVYLGTRKSIRGATGAPGADGESGVYVGSGTAPEGTKVQVDPEAEGELVIPEVKQKTGNSTEDTMSQAAITELVEGCSLGIASDGLIYLFVEGKPVGTGMPQGTSGDIFGYVDENNTVVLKGDLADGTYNIKYETEDGSVIAIGNLTLGKEDIVSYQQCAYIENSDQNSYVDLGIVNTETTGIQIKYELTSVSSTLGAIGIMGNSDIAIGHPSTANTDLRAYWGGIKSYQLLASTAVDTEYTVGVNYCNSGKSNINGTDKAWNSGTKTFEKSGTITICKQNGGKNFAKNARIKIKEVHISEGTDVSKHYVPAYRSTDGAIGMLETNSNTFIVATGNFTKGADV